MSDPLEYSTRRRSCSVLSDEVAPRRSITLMFLSCRTALVLLLCALLFLMDSLEVAVLWRPFKVIASSSKIDALTVDITFFCLGVFCQSLFDDPEGEHSSAASTLGLPRRLSYVCFVKLD